MGLVENANYRKFTEASGWQDFVENDKNALASAPGELGLCPEPTSDAYREGLNAGDYCLRLTIEDGGPNDADGVKNGTVKDPGAVAVAEIATPVITAALAEIAQGDFSAGAGEQLVMGISLTSDSTDVALSSLTLEASGDINETSAIDQVSIYVDKNSNGVAEAAELLGQANYRQDNGQVTINFDEPMHLKLGTTELLVTYQF